MMTTNRRRPSPTVRVSRTGPARPGAGPEAIPEDRPGRAARVVAVALIFGFLGACGGLPEPPPPMPEPQSPTPVPHSSSTDGRPTPSEATVRPPALEAPRPIPPRVRWEPAEPGEGTLVTLLLEPYPAGLPVLEAAGTVDGRDLSLVPLAGGTWLGLVAAPLDAGQIAVELSLTLIDGTELTRSLTIPVAARSFPSTTLSVARRFTSPDPAVLERIVRERDRVRAMLREVTSEPLWSGAFVHPRPGTTTSPFGQRRLFNDELRSRHTGLDIRADTGTPVFAANSGRVALAGELYFTGNTVYLDHGLGLHTAYFHLSRLEVGEGEWVEKGELIGLVGATGRVTGPHLHWGLYLSGVPLDPVSLLQPGVARAGERLADWSRSPETASSR
jgi:murein DD-endopeptidase MepM/ murein hydrolase activator NlpD